MNVQYPDSMVAELNKLLDGCPRVGEAVERDRTFSKDGKTGSARATSFSEDVIVGQKSTKLFDDLLVSASTALLEREGVHVLVADELGDSRDAMSTVLDVERHDPQTLR